MYCRRCGVPLHQGLVICPECGSRQRRRFSAVRCAGCGGRVALGLSVCPHCGRTVRPAGPRFGLWLTGIVVVAVVGLWGAGKLPVDRMIEEVASIRQRVSSVVQVLGPVASPGESSAPTAEEIAEATGIGETEEVVVTGAGPLPLESEVGSGTPAATPEIGAVDAMSATLTVETPVATPVATLVATPVATLTAEASATTTPTPTPALSPTSTLEPTSAPTATPEPSAATPQAAAPTGPITYTVKSGDSLSSIASSFGILWQDLAAANGMTSRSVLRSGQILVIPGSETPAPVTPTPTSRVAVAPTATRPPSLAAPVLRSPGDQTPLSGAQSFELVWEPVGRIPAGAQYQAMIRWTDEGGGAQQYWWYTSATSSLIPLGIYQKAAQPARKYTWYVTVVQLTTDGKGGEKVIPLSPPSGMRVFYWN